MTNSLLLSPRIGLGCMNLSHAYGAPLTEKEGIYALHAAMDMGYRHFDTATLYGKGGNEKLLGQALKGKRETVFLASKGGMFIDNVSGRKTIDGSAKSIRHQCEQSLKRLNTDYIDLYYLHRLDAEIPIEESVQALARLVEEGKIGAIGLSEVSAHTLARAHQIYPIAALQSEYSIWTRNPEIAALQKCAELGTTFVAFSPIARGFLANSVVDIDNIQPGDIRLNMPRFQEPHFTKNMLLLNQFNTIATQINIAPAQLALAWVLAQGEHVIAIPGTRSIPHMRENLSAINVTLGPQTIAQLNQLINHTTVNGARYNTAQQCEIDTEEFFD